MQLLRFRYSSAGAIVIAVCGCASTGSLVSAPHATLNDVAVKMEHEAGYKLVAVDGKPVERRQSRVSSVVPFALIEPGTHKLSLELKKTVISNPELTTITASFEAGKQYRFKVDQDVVTVVEDIE
jgi:hypothetical protein